MRDIKMTKYTHVKGTYRVSFEILGAKNYKDAVEKMLEIVLDGSQYWVDVKNLYTGKEYIPVDIRTGMDMDEDEEEADKSLYATFFPDLFKDYWPRENINNYK